MKFWKLTLLTVCSFFALSATVLVASCEKDACTDLKCKNGSACTDGFCRCPTGYEGAECEYKTIDRFLGTYYGFNYCDDLPPLLDTLDVIQFAAPNQVAFNLRHNSYGGNIQGTVSGYTITVADQQQGEGIRKVNAVIDHNQISVLVERDFNAGVPGNKSVCTFTGTRR